MQTTFDIYAPEAIFHDPVGIAEGVQSIRAQFVGLAKVCSMRNSPIGDLLTAHADLRPRGHPQVSRAREPGVGVGVRAYFIIRHLFAPCNRKYIPLQISASENPTWVKCYDAFMCAKLKVGSLHINGSAQLILSPVGPSRLLRSLGRIGQHRTRKVSRESSYRS